MLRGVVTSGSGIGLADVPGPQVIAKTGTAEFQGDKGIETHAWMIAAQGDLAVAVFVEVGQSGSSTAGPDPGAVPARCPLRVPRAGVGADTRTRGPGSPGPEPPRAGRA